MSAEKSIPDGKKLLSSTASSFHHSRKSTKHTFSISQDFSSTVSKVETGNDKLSGWKIDNFSQKKSIDHRATINGVQNENIGPRLNEKPKTSYSQNRLKMLISPTIPEMSEIKAEMRSVVTTSAGVRVRKQMENQSFSSFGGSKTSLVFPKFRAKREDSSKTDKMASVFPQKISKIEDHQEIDGNNFTRSSNLKRMTSKKLSISNLQLNFHSKAELGPQEENEGSDIKMSRSSEEENSWQEDGNSNNKQIQADFSKQKFSRNLTKHISDGLGVDGKGAKKESSSNKFFEKRKMSIVRPKNKGKNIASIDKIVDKDMGNDSEHNRSCAENKDDSFDIYGYTFGFNADPKVKKVKKHIGKFKVANKIVNSLTQDQKHTHPLVSLNKGRDIKENYESALNALTVNAEIYKEAIGVYKDREKLEALLNRALLICSNSKNMLIYLYNMKTVAKLSYKMQNIFRSLSLYNECMHIAEIHKEYFIALKCNKGIGFCFQHLKLYQKAMSYFIKMLHISWYLDEEAEELVAYDCVGMQYFYMGDLTKARYYHRRMMNGEVESSDSSVRILGISKYKNHLLIIESRLLGLEPHKQPGPFVKEDVESNFAFVNQFSDDEEDELPMSEAMGGEIIKKPQKKRKKVKLCYGYKDIKDQTFKNSNTLDVNNGKLMLMMKEKGFSNSTIGNVEYKKADTLIQTLLKSKLKQSIGFSNMKVKDKIMVSHLSPNRVISKYQILVPKVHSLKHFQLNDHTYNNVDINRFAQVEAMLKKFAENMYLCISKIEFLVKKSETNMPGRKQGFVVDKRRRSSLGLL